MPEPRDDDAAPRSDGRVRVRERRRRSRSWGRRKHLGLITVGAAVVVLVVGLLAVVVTWDNGRTPLSRQAAALSTGTATGTATGTGTTTVVPSTPAATTPPSSAAPAAAAVRGIIQSVGDSQYVMVSGTGITYTVVITATTAFTRNRSFTSFGEGDPIAVRGTLDAGVLTASSISPTNPPR